jgi:preprotein translocase subunit SecG
MNTFWSTLVQSGSPLPLSSSSLLAGHSSGAVMALTTLWMTLVLLIGYLCYMSLWSDMRAWLASKGRAAAAQGAETVDIGGVALTLEQLRRMCNSPFALLLQSTGIAGTLAKVLMHLGLVNFVCILAWVVSHLLVQQFLPGALPQSLLGTYYSPLPQQQAQDVSSAIMLG